MQFVMFTIMLTYVILVSCYSINEFVLNTEKGSKMNKRLVCAVVAAAVILSAEWLCGSFLPYNYIASLTTSHNSTHYFYDRGERS